MILPREHFETEHMAELRRVHAAGQCMNDPNDRACCPYCRYERQFPSPEHRKRWEEDQRRELLRTKYLL